MTRHTATQTIIARPANSMLSLRATTGLRPTWACPALSPILPEDLTTQDISNIQPVYRQQPRMGCAGSG